MYEIPKPQTLDPDRLLRKRGPLLTEDDRPEAELLRIALRESCAYAEQLWDTLDAQRAYLLTSLPPDPRAPGPKRTAGAAPTGPDDESGWEHWISAFAATTSVLCGPHGDSGFGLSRAREEAQIRRTAPVLMLAGNEEQSPGGVDEPPADSSNPVTSAPASAAQHDGGGSARSALRVAVTIGVALAAVRGLLPRRPRPSSTDAA